MNGKVYFVAAPGRIKVGYTSRPEQRLRDLQSGDMEQLTAIAVIDGTRKLEQKLHGLLAPHRLRGEWFNDCQAVRDVMDRAVSGEFAEETLDDDEQSSAPTYYCDPDFPLAVITSAIDRCKKITAQIADRAGRGESTIELALEVQFLAENVIGPGLYGRSSTHIHKADPPR